MERRLGEVFDFCGIKLLVQKRDAFSCDGCFSLREAYHAVFILFRNIVVIVAVMREKMKHVYFSKNWTQIIRRNNHK